MTKINCNFINNEQLKELCLELTEPCIMNDPGCDLAGPMWARLQGIVQAKCDPRALVDALVSILAIINSLEITNMQEENQMLCKVLKILLD